jgi:hypothetical protein
LSEQATAGIPPGFIPKGEPIGGRGAQAGALQQLQFFNSKIHTDPAVQQNIDDELLGAAKEVSTYHPPTLQQGHRHANMAIALENFLVTLVLNCPPGPERSTAISRAREAKMWASAAIALEGK